MRRSEQHLSRITAEAEDVVCPRSGGCGIEPAEDPDETVSEAWEELPSMAPGRRRRHPPSTAYAISEAVGVERSVSRSFRLAPLFRGLFTAQIAIGAATIAIMATIVAAQAPTGLA